MTAGWNGRFNATDEMIVETYLAHFTNSQFFLVLGPACRSLLGVGYPSFAISTMQKRTSFVSNSCWIIFVKQYLWVFEQQCYIISKFLHRTSWNWLYIGTQRTCSFCLEVCWFQRAMNFEIGLYILDYKIESYKYIYSYPQYLFFPMISPSALLPITKSEVSFHPCSSWRRQSVEASNLYFSLKDADLAVAILAQKSRKTKTFRRASQLISSTSVSGATSTMVKSRSKASFLSFEAPFWRKSRRKASFWRFEIATSNPFSFNSFELQK